MSKTRQILLIGHGKIASGVLSSVELIFGKSKNLYSIDTYTDSNFNLVNTVQNLIEKNKDNDLIIVTDLFGGSVNNEFLKYVGNENLYIVTGMNLALVLELVSKLNMSENESVDEIIKHAIASTKNSIQYCNREAFNSFESEDEDF